jgi:hypothetical protein
MNNNPRSLRVTSQRQRALRSGDLLGGISQSLHVDGVIQSLFNLLRFPRQILKPIIICELLCGLMLCNLVADPMPTTSQQQTKNGQSKSGQTASGGVAQDNAASSGGISTKSRNASESLKALFAHKAPIRLTIVIMALSGFSLGYQTCKWRMEKRIRSMPPNGTR